LTPPDVWIRHRKLCKKRASAKWYVKKKEAEIQEQREHRRRLAEQLQHKQRLPLFSLEQLTYNRCSFAHLYFGYPMCPPDVSIWLWDYWKDRVEEQLDLCRHTFPRWRWDRRILVQLRQLGIREHMHHHTGYTDGCAIQRFRSQVECTSPGRFVSLLVGPVGWMWCRLQDVVHDSTVWPRWIQAIQRMYSRHRCQASTTSTPIPIKGNSTTPMTNPNQKDHQATQTNDSSAGDQSITPGRWEGIQPLWCQHTGEWESLVEGFESWLRTQPPSVESADIDLSSTASSDSQSSLDSSLVRDLFDNERPPTPPNGTTDSQPTPSFPGFPRYFSDEDYHSSDEST
jgi:hypothetical protein